MSWKLCLTAATFAAALVPPTMASAATGHGSKQDVKDYCNRVGGELLGEDEHGHYGCDDGKNNVLILCNKKEQCQVTRMVATGPSVRKALRNLNRR
jgi:hypothetical protein